LCLNSSASVKNAGDIVLLDEEILVAAPQNNIYHNKDSVLLADLKNEGFISLSKGTAFRAIMDDYCDSINFMPKIVYESDLPDTVRGLIREGVGLAFWPSRSWGALSEDKIKTLHIADINARRVITLSAPEGKAITKAVSAFSGFAIDYFNML